VRECAVQLTGAISAILRPIPSPSPETEGGLRSRRQHSPSADKARVSVRLLPTSGGAPLWAETLEEGCEDIFAFEDSISDELAGAAALVLTSAERKLLARRYTENAAAYQAYLKGRLHWPCDPRKGSNAPSSSFRRAIDIDSEYALAHSALASSYALQCRCWGPSPPHLHAPRESGRRPCAGDRRHAA